jgi:ethanolamine ammonia-lyase large subunit
MNNQGNFNEDLLRKYISREKIEEAPDGFTSKVMARVSKEATPVVVREHMWKKYMVPAISALITVSLFVAAFLIPENQTDTVSLTILKIIKNLKFSIPEIDLSSIFTLTLPSVALYTIIGIVCLTIFDRALSGIFKKMP